MPDKTSAEERSAYPVRLGMDTRQVIGRSSHDRILEDVLHTSLTTRTGHHLGRGSHGKARVGGWA